jgi:hypothetical protein
MNSIAGKTLFRLALALSLISICLSAYVLMRAQSGPSWEVPAAVVRELATILEQPLGKYRGRITEWFLDRLGRCLDFPSLHPASSA